MTRPKQSKKIGCLSLKKKKKTNLIQEVCKKKEEEEEMEETGEEENTDPAAMLTGALPGHTLGAGKAAAQFPFPDLWGCWGRAGLTNDGTEPGRGPRVMKHSPGRQGGVGVGPVPTRASPQCDCPSQTWSRRCLKWKPPVGIIPHTCLSCPTLPSCVLQAEDTGDARP